MARTLRVNADGLVEGHGTRQSERVGRKPNKGGMIQEVVLEIRGTDLSDTVAAANASRGAVIPSGAHITNATLWVTTAFTSAGSAVLDIGVYKQSDGTAVDDDGIDAAIAKATLADNAQITCDGALVDTTLANDSLIHASYDTAAFTAGVAQLVVEYIVKG